MVTINSHQTTQLTEVKRGTDNDLQSNQGGNEITYRDPASG